MSGINLEEIKSPAKREVIKFLQNTKADQDYKFFLPNADEAEALAFLQRMRVELSRLRNLMIERGRKVAQFKVIKESISQGKDGCVITIRKQISQQSRASKLLSGIEDLLEEDDNG